MEVLAPEYSVPETDPEVCHWCRAPFRQLRFPITTEVRFGSGWEVVSVCGLCFKRASADETTRMERYLRNCDGCGKPMRTPLDGRFRWCVCSSRCYQRAHRKMRRWFMTCEACKKPFKPARTDARYCSSACRQRTYRQKKRGRPAARSPTSELGSEVVSQPGT